MKVSETDFKRLTRRVAELDRARQDFVEIWKDVRDYIYPDSSLGLSSSYTSTGTDTADSGAAGMWTANVREPESGQHRYGEIYDGAPISAVEIFTAGVYSGTVPPTAPWLRFRVKGMNREQQDQTPVKRYLDECVEEIQHALHRWGLYEAFHQAIHELAVYGTACAGVYDDPEHECVVERYTCGEYWLGLSPAGKVQTTAIQRMLTVQQLVEEYGLEECSDRVQELYKRDKLDERVAVLRVIEPNDSRMKGALRPHWFENGEDRGQAKFRSVTWESGERSKSRVLRIEGYNSFPILAPRWSLTGNAAYGRSPGMRALNDSLVLQATHKKVLTALDMQIEPPLAVDAALAAEDLNRNPRGVNYVDGIMSQGRAPIMPLHNVQVPWQLPQWVEEAAKANIREAFFTDLFLLIASQPMSSRMTATEVLARQQEKVQILGPSYQRIVRELVEAALDRTWEVLRASGRLPEPPPALEGRTLEYEFVSPLQTALQMTRLTGLNQLVGWVGNAAQFAPEVRHKVRWDEAVDFVAEVANVPAHLVTADEDYDRILQAQARDQQAQVQAEREQIQAQTALALSRAQLDQNSMLAQTAAAQQTGLPGGGA